MQQRRKVLLIGAVAVAVVLAVVGLAVYRWRRKERKDDDAKKEASACVCAGLAATVVSAGQKSCLEAAQDLNAQYQGYQTEYSDSVKKAGQNQQARQAAFAKLAQQTHDMYARFDQEYGHCLAEMAPASKQEVAAGSTPPPQNNLSALTFMSQVVDTPAARAPDMPADELSNLSCELNERECIHDVGKLPQVPPNGVAWQQLKEIPTCLPQPCFRVNMPENVPLPEPSAVALQQIRNGPAFISQNDVYIRVHARFRPVIRYVANVVMQQLTQANVDDFTWQVRVTTSTAKVSPVLFYVSETCVNTGAQRHLYLCPHGEVNATGDRELAVRELSRTQVNAPAAKVSDALDCLWYPSYVILGQQLFFYLQSAKYNNWYIVPSGGRPVLRRCPVPLIANDPQFAAQASWTLYQGGS